MPEIDIKTFKQACWEKRKETGRKYLTKSQLADATRMAIEAKLNQQKVKDLITGFKCLNS